MSDTRASYENQRWVDCWLDQSSFAPSFGVMEYTGVREPTPEVISCRNINREGEENVCFNGPKTLNPGDYGECTFGSDAPFLCRYEGQAVTGGLYGPVPGSSGLWSGVSENGWPMIGAVDTDEQIALFGPRMGTAGPILSVRLTGTHTIDEVLTATGFYAGSNYSGVFAPTATGIRILTKGVYYLNLSLTWNPPTSVSENLSGPYQVACEVPGFWERTPFTGGGHWWHLFEETMLAQAIAGGGAYLMPTSRDARTRGPDKFAKSDDPEFPFDVLVRVVLPQSGFAYPGIPQNELTAVLTISKQ